MNPQQKAGRENADRPVVSDMDVASDAKLPVADPNGDPPVSEATVVEELKDT